jgi:glycosyltransferase involved in cell wall biosynthesis
MTPDLSVLVCSVDTRYRTFALRMQDQLWEQRNALPDPRRVEVIILTDARQMSIGRKRNLLVQAATGRYVQFIDDDDRIAEGALAAVLAATGSDADVIVFPAMVSLGGGPQRMCVYSMKFERDENTQQMYKRIPNHICAVKRELAVQVPFADICMGEDADYAQRLKPLLTSEYVIQRPLYHYDFDPRTSECRR